MSDYNWCHGPECHEQQTQSRVRGSGRDKVLRTIKIKHDSNYRSHDRYQMFNYFCGQNCLMDYIRLHLQSKSLFAIFTSGGEDGPKGRPAGARSTQNAKHNVEIFKNKSGRGKIHWI